MLKRERLLLQPKSNYHKLILLDNAHVFNNYELQNVDDMIDSLNGVVVVL